MGDGTRVAEEIEAIFERAGGQGFLLLESPVGGKECGLRGDEPVIPTSAIKVLVASEAECRTAEAVWIPRRRRSCAPRTGPRTGRGLTVRRRHGHDPAGQGRPGLTISYNPIADAAEPSCRIDGRTAPGVRPPLRRLGRRRPTRAAPRAVSRRSPSTARHPSPPCAPLRAGSPPASTSSRPGQRVARTRPGHRRLDPGVLEQADRRPALRLQHRLPSCGPDGPLRCASGTVFPMPSKNAKHQAPGALRLARRRRRTGPLRDRPVRRAAGPWGRKEATPGWRRR